MKKKRALVTGITGFVGSHLAERLLKHGWDVSGIIRPTSCTDQLAKSVIERGKFYPYQQMSDIRNIVHRVKPDVVFHLAAAGAADIKKAGVSQLIDSNIKFGTVLLEAMAGEGILNFVDAETSWQHYQGAEYSPVNLYAATKQAFLDISRYYEEAYHLHGIHLQLFDNYGPRDRRHKIWSLFEEYSKSGETLAMSPGEQRIDLVHVEDVAGAFELAADYLCDERYELCGVYAVSAGTSLSLRELAEKYELLTGRKLHIHWGGRPYRPREVMIPWQKGKLLPGWKRIHCEIM